MSTPVSVLESAPAIIDIGQSKIDIIQSKRSVNVSFAGSAPKRSPAVGFVTACIGVGVAVAVIAALKGE